MGKFKMPTVQEFLKIKRIFGPIKDPVWVYLEREMRENAEKKPYNTKVANWLLFLKSLRYHYYREAKYKYNRLCRESGPAWYLEFSKEQRSILENLKAHIHEDVLEDVTTRTKQSLRAIGVTLKLSHHTLMDAMLEAKEDPGVFIWLLYEKLFKVPPSQPQTVYNQDSMLLMSALVVLDLDECLETLEKITHGDVTPPSHAQKKKRSYFEPKVKYGVYLQRLRVPVYSTHPATLPKPKKPIPFSPRNLRLRSKESCEQLASSTLFLELRKRRYMKESITERKCKYKFWEPPATLRNTDPKMAAYVIKLKMLNLRPRRSYLKHKPPYENVQILVGAVTYSAGRPIFLMSSVVLISTGSTPIHGGLVKVNNELVTNFLGMSKRLVLNKDKCEKTCNCLGMINKVEKYLEYSKCKCGHFYDFESLCSPTVDSVPRHTFFYPPTKYTPLLFDHAKIYQLDSSLEYTHDEFVRLFESESSNPPSTEGEITFSNLSEKAILKLLFANISETPLIIPHLPQANLLNSLLEWVRRRLHGNLTPAEHKRLMLISQRRWLDLSHIDFRAKAYLIPFTLKQLDHMNWSHRHMVQKLFKILLRNFEARTRQLQLEQTRLWWPTMAYDAYPNKAFLDVFFTYMPCRYRDTLVLNPYCAAHYITVTSGTCPLAQMED